ncbi:hypothetical protein GOP47_0004904 [Adiantum capillus-veneris]|uniref:AB hydrolase-1 domain-containing protein n=1 Tax=Adiantum capillus-veneris TaxID=13818 RepID=A0A9D4V452_ADICA|nr:hypothetical protein GOP47_0004904 [Adiantum capillus-veneris]
MEMEEVRSEETAMYGQGGGASEEGVMCSGGVSDEGFDDELSMLPRHTKVIVIGNNRTKSVLVGLQGIVKKAVGLGGWHWLPCGSTASRVSRDLNGFIVCVHDIVGLLDALHLDKVYVVAKDWGAFVGYAFGYIHPERVLGLAALGTPFFKPVALLELRKHISDGHYTKCWSLPGVPEADFGCLDVATIIKRIYILLCNSSMPIALDKEKTLDLVKASDPLPDWMTEEDLQVYAELYKSSGFEYPMEVPYRCWERNAAKLANQEDLRFPLLSC